ncbi:MAG: cytochrome c [Flavobacteriales bacterium]|nr:cytochrome c [Flavobacteriales bacterium]
MRRLLLFPLLLFAMLLGCGSDPGHPSGTAATDGAAIYAGQCVLCHGDDGKLGLSGAKDLTMSELSKKEMIALVTNGKGLMMPYGRVLTAEEIEAVVDHVRALGKRP